MLGSIRFSKCSCGGVICHQLDVLDGLSFYNCSKCGLYHRDYPLSDEHDGLIYTMIASDGGKKKQVAFKTKAGGGLGTVKLLAKTHLVSYYSIDSLDEAEQLIQSLNDGEYPEVDVSSSYIYLHHPQNNTGEVVWGYGKPVEFDVMEAGDDEAFEKACYDCVGIIL